MCIYMCMCCVGNKMSKHLLPCLIAFEVLHISALSVCIAAQLCIYQGIYKIWETKAIQRH